jgi:hypothetical protein
MIKLIFVNVSYFDSVNGGAGLTSVGLMQLADWLTAHPGYLIRAIQMPLELKEAL